MGNGMRKKYKILFGAIVLVSLLGGYLGFGHGGSSVMQQQKADSGQNAFLGKMEGDYFAAQLADLSVISDSGCAIDQKTQLTNCTAGIQDLKGTVYFNYEHNMTAKPCLSKGDRVSLAVNSDGTAVATRTYQAGGGM